MLHLEGTPSDDLPGVLATGASDIGYAFISLSGRDPDGRDAAYIEWHSLDHRPEQHRLTGMRQSLRLVSTPECRAVRAASEGAYDQVDHVMTYMFTDGSGIPGFSDLGAALDQAGRMPHRLPSVGYMTVDLAGKVAAPEAVAGADVVPFRPATGVYLLIEEGESSPVDLVGVPGVAGVWWWRGNASPPPFPNDARGKQATYCFLDGDPVETGKALGELVRKRWAVGSVKGLLAAPFFTITPFDWGRHVP